MFTKNTYTTEEMVGLYCESNNVKVPEGPFSKALIYEADRFACDNDFYFFPFDEVYKKPADDEMSFRVG